MTIKLDVKPLDTSEFKYGSPILASNFKNIMSMLNALLEYTEDSTAVGGSTQTIAGHDHADNGGTPLINNAISSVNSLNYAVSGANTYSGDDVVVYRELSPFYVSPNLSQYKNTSLELYIFYSLLNADAYLSVGSGTPVLAKRTGDGKNSYIKVNVPIVSDTEWQNLNLKIKFDKKEQDEEIYLYIRGYSLVETYQSSQPVLGAIEPKIIGGDPNVLRYFDVLFEELADDEYPMSSELLKRLYSATNALYELVTDKSAIGRNTSEQQVIGHDHATNSGISMGHGLVFSIWQGNYAPSAHQQLWTCNATVQNTWYGADHGMSISLTDNSIELFNAPISYGLNSSGNPPTSAPALDGWLKVYYGTGGAVEARIYNHTTATYSPIFTMTSGVSKYINFIPCKANTWNKFTLELRYTTLPSTPTVIETVGLILNESYTKDGNAVTKLTSAGTRLLATTRGLP